MKRILWFTDTITDLNGVSITLKNVGWLAHKQNKNVRIVSSLPPEKITDELPPTYINIRPKFIFKMPYYDKLTLKIASFRHIYKIAKEFKADEIIISSPAFVGLWGLILAKIFRIKTTAIYHTDFTAQAEKIFERKNILTFLVELYTKWFHESADKILVPTIEYIEILSERGFDKDKLDIFKRGIDTDLFSPIPHQKEQLIKRYNLPSNSVLFLYTGRVSQDKNLDFVINALEMINQIHNNVYFLIAGDGPYLNTIRHYKKKNIIFLGQINNKDLPKIYSGCDCLLFPSETDTFGMTVLEAQACGLPAIVSDVGGPKNIIIDKQTGWVISTKKPHKWIKRINKIITQLRNGNTLDDIKNSSRKNIIENYTLNTFFDQFYDK